MTPLLRPRSGRGQLTTLRRDAWARLRAEVWPITQSTAAATLAWVIAKHLVEHHQPFFAPIAAIAALNASRGERGSNALRLLQGVIVGILFAQLTVWVLGAGYEALAAATFGAMIIALVLGGGRIVIAQAAAGAILTVTTNTPDVGLGRLTDALIGAGVALVFSQLLFPTEPVALLRRAEAAVLNDIARALELAAQSLETGDVPANQATDELRDVRDRLSELARTRTRSERSVKRSPVWWTRTTLVVRESENAAQLDLLSTSALTLTRAMARTNRVGRHEFAPAVYELAAVLSALAKAPGVRAVRQQAADRALEATHDLGSDQTDTSQASATAARLSVRQLAMDTMIFAGIETEQAAQAVEHGSGQLHVPDQPSPHQIHPKSLRLLHNWWSRRRNHH